MLAYVSSIPGGCAMARESRPDRTDDAHRAVAQLEPDALNERLLNAIFSISRCATLDEALEPLLDAALDVTKMDGGGVYWVENDVAVLRHHRGLPEAFIREVASMPLTPPPIQTVLQQQEPVELAEISSAMRRLLHKHGIRHAFSFPLRARGILFGVLNVGSIRTEAPERADIEALWVLVNEIESLFFRLYSEKALRESEERYRSLWESALDAIALYELPVSSQEGGFVDVNDCACRMLGYAREEFLKLSPLDVVEEDARETIPGLIAKIRESGRMLLEITLVAKDGRRIPVEVNASLVQFGGRHLALGVIRDVTERKRAAEALRESEQRYRSLWESARDGLVLHELLSSPLKGRFVDANDRLCRVLGYTREEILAMSLLDIVADEEKEALPELAAQVRRAGRMLFEATLVAKDGRRIPVEVNSNVVQLGERRLALAIVRDVTERKRTAEALRESDERFRAFMNNSPAIAWMKDEQGRHVYLSEAYEKRFGVRFEDWRGKTDFELWPREVAEEFRRNDLEVLRTGRTLEVVEESPAPDGGRCYWWSFKFPFQDASGRKYVGGIGVDITQRKRMEAILQEANERLERQVRARTTELTRTIDRLQAAMEELEHRAGQLQKLTLELSQAEDRERRRLGEFLHDDLQQTLAAAKFHLGIVAGRVRNDKEAMETLEQTRHMLKEAIEKTRCLSHELGPPVLYSGKLDAIFEWLAGQMESKHGLTVRVEIRGDADSDSEAVRSFLYRAAREILFNAVKHAQAREVRLRLQRVRDELWLTISDKGRGFDPASLAQTTGLGLLTIRERAELLGGRMKIKSAPGRGSIFFIVVPDSGAGHDSPP